MFHTIYQQQAQRPKGAGNFWKIIIPITLILIVAVPLLTNGNYVALGPSPLLIIIIWRATRNKTESINFYVSQDHRNEFQFGYKDSGNIHHGPFPIDEYTYWCFQGTTANRGWNYELYMQINSKHSTVYLKEKITAQTPPSGWTRTPQQIQDGEGVFVVPGLPALAAMIDKAAANDPVEPQPISVQE